MLDGKHGNKPTDPGECGLFQLMIELSHVEVPHQECNIFVLVRSQTIKYLDFQFVVPVPGPSNCQ